MKTRDVEQQVNLAKATIEEGSRPTAAPAAFTAR
jgi:hypothetical protein